MNRQIVYCPNCFELCSPQETHCKACGYSLAVTQDERSLSVGDDLHGTYTVGRVLGTGGFGITYLCMDRRYSRICAIKEYFPGEWVKRVPMTKRMMLTDSRFEANYRHGLEVFLNEAKILYGLRDNSAVVNVSDFFQENQTAYLVMEYVEGETLAQHIMKQKKPLSYDEANRMIFNIASALGYIHKKGLLHRDISPDNIMLTKDGNMKLIDFGATRQYVSNETVDMSVLVKTGFSPLEQYSRSGNQGPWSDIYALAATYYYVLSGKKPLTANERCSGMTMKSLHDRQSNVPQAVSNVINTCLDMDYTKRPQNMDRFLELFRNAVLSGETPKAHMYFYQNGKMVRKWHMLPGRTVRIGRSMSECDICIEDSMISRVHCSIRYEALENAIYVTDYSSNGTYTAMGLIGKNRFQRLMMGSEIFLVSDKYRFKMEVN